MKRNYVVNLAGVNVDEKALTRLVVLSKTWKKQATIKGTPENLEARDLIARGFFFVDGTTYRKKSDFTEIRNCSNFAGSSCTEIKIPC